jgi:dihydrofolate reductase
VRQVVLLLTASLDGFIADPNGGVDWLTTPTDDVPDDYHALLDSIDCLVMGSATYLVSLELAGGTDIFQGKAVFVFSSQTTLPATPGVTVVHSDAELFVRSLKESDGDTIWLFGGGKLATALSDADLVDDYFVVIQPMLLGDGIPLWTTPHGRTPLSLTGTQEWPDGLVALRYSRSNRTH